MSSLGSSTSSQTSEDVMPSQPVTRHEDPPLGRIESEHGTSSSRGSVYDDLNHAKLVRSNPSDGPIRMLGFDSPARTELGSSSHGPHSVANLNDGGGHQPPTWSEFLRESSGLTAGTGPSNDADTMSTLAADRKRRLTATAQDSGRRTGGGGFHNWHPSGQSYQSQGPSSAQISAWPRRTDSVDHSQPTYVDLTSSPPAVPQQLGRISSARPPFISTRQYVLPKWQPDSETSECPICKRQFSLLFRRHHCRKCGRVVCNDCSPHRITIPRQFIVHPPDPSKQIQPIPHVSRTPVETIDLTEDTDRDKRLNMSRTATAGSNPALGGGEKVRLCNPCVPDPQPSPHLDSNLSRSPFATRSPWETASGHAIPSRSSNDLAIPQLASTYQAGLSELGSEVRRQGSHGMMPVSDGADTTQTRIGETLTPRAPPYGIFNNTAMPNFSRPDRPPIYQSYPHAAMPPPGYHATSASQFPAIVSRPNQSRGAGSVTGMPPPHLRQSTGVQLPLHGHARYQSLGTASRSALPAVNRPRVRSLLDADPTLQRFMDQATASGSSRPPADNRPRLHERDICPVCRHALPPQGADGDETAREAHIMDCIDGREHNTSSSISAQRDSLGNSPPDAPIRMLQFVASEKDCMGENGNFQECSICMVEYDVGDQLARLECLCKFHKACIVEWFGRKQECPVHKIA